MREITTVRSKYAKNHPGWSALAATQTPPLLVTPGAPTPHANGKYRRPYLFVMTLQFSGKSFRKVLWQTSQETWARLHEDAFRTLGGCCKYVALDNLKEGVIRPDICTSELNPGCAAMLAHYSAVADPCRGRDPNRKGTVENAIQHIQTTALKGRRFESIEAQNEWLAHWEERWVTPRIDRLTQAREAQDGTSSVFLRHSGLPSGRVDRLNNRRYTRS